MDRKNKEKITMSKKVELAIAILGFFLAIASLFYTYFQFQDQFELAQQTHIAQSKPHLIIEYNKADGNKIKGLLLKNVGIGPAEIIEFNIYPNRKQYESGQPRKAWLDKNEKFWFEPAFTYYPLNFLTPGHVISQDGNGDLYLIGTDGNGLTPLGVNLINNKRRTAPQCISKTQEEKNCILKFSDTKDKEILEKVIVEIRYTSLSDIDKNIYTLTFSEKFIENNMTTVSRGGKEKIIKEHLDKSSIRYETE